MRDSTRKAYDQVLGVLRGVRTKELLVRATQGFLFCGSIVCALLILSLSVEGLLYLGATVRTIIFWSILGITAILFVWKVARPFLTLGGLLPGEGDLVTARRLGMKFPEVRDHLVNALQLLTERNSSRYYSEEFIDAAFEDAKRDLDSTDISGAARFSEVRGIGTILGYVVAVAVLLFVLFPMLFFGSLGRLWNYSDSYAAPAPFRLLVEPGSREVVRGEDVQIIARVDGEPPPQLVLASRPEKQTQDELTEMKRGEDGTFRFEFESLKLSTKYRVEAGDVKSEEYSLQVVDRPVVRLLRLTIDPPRYSGLARHQLDNNVGDVTALKGTRIEFSLEANKALAEAALVMAKGSESTMDVERSRATTSMRLLSETAYSLRLKDMAGLTNTDPVRYMLRVVPDNSPRAWIERPGIDLDVAGNEKLAMLFRITDDYGFSRLRLAHRLTQSRYEPPEEEYSFVDVPIPAGVRSEGIISFVWPLETLHLVPEDVVTYALEVYDNDDISGPKGAWSQSYTLRLPSLEEVFADIDKGHDVGLEKFREALEETEKARKELDELQQELRKKENSMEWQEEKRAEELLEQYQQVQKNIDEATRTLDEMTSEMQKNQVLSTETVEKYMELQRLMEELNSSELADALKKLQESLRQLSPEALKEALQQLSLTEAQLRKSIERTIDLLKRIQIEQKVDEAIRRTEELMKEQSELQQSTEAEREKSTQKGDQLAKRQQELSSELGDLSRQLDELRKAMEEFPEEMPLKEMQEAQAGLDSSGLAELMKEISEQLSRMQMSDASQGQKQAMQKMGSFMDQLRSMRDALRANQQQQIVNELRKAYQDLLELSRREEAMKAETGELQQNSPLFREGVGEQMDAIRDLGRVSDRLSDVAKKSFGVTPEMERTIGEALKEMSNAMQSLEQRNSAGACEHQGNAMASLNEAAQHVEAGMNAMMQGQGQGMGMSGLMQRLQGMTAMQQGINRGTQHLGGLGKQQAAEMQRLAGEQGMLRKSLEQLAREASYAGELSKLLGDLRRVAQDMREVQTDLAQGNLTPETTRKQDRILSRLLDSQRSMRERDYEKKRQAETGKEYTRDKLPSFDVTTKEGRDRLRLDLLKAMEEGYSRDYEALIKMYFELLESEEQ